MNLLLTEINFYYFYFDIFFTYILLNNSILWLQILILF